MDVIAFPAAFEALTGNGPFPWQEALYARFKDGIIERSLDIPTGLGKTTVMALWLLARAHGAVLPRRLVYVVDRRAVVDQATDQAMGLRESIDRNMELKQSLGLGTRSLPISTLRGQQVDNREWLENPASPAIVVGTVDMIGSRLLFEGYGTSRKMRPYYAGLLGADTLLVLDEAHLVPPFEKLVEAIASGEVRFDPRDEELRGLVPPFRLLSLSATGRAIAGNSFGLQEGDLKHPVVRRRLDAPKRLTVERLDDDTKLRDAIAGRAWRLSENSRVPLRIIVYCDKREDAAAARAAVEERAKGNEKQGIPRVIVETELFVGGRRVFEREGAAKWLRDRGFIASEKVRPTSPTFVFATSAGEVGVDLDADHMVSDLVAWERMVQRLGRVNRRGDGDANVIVIAEPKPKPETALAKEPAERTKAESKAVAEYVEYMARSRAINCLPMKVGAHDASPGAIRELKLKAQNDASLNSILDTATTPAPLRPGLSRALVDAWSMTSLEKHTGRPEIGPWLRGWKDDPPQTSVVWRVHLPVRPQGGETRKEVEAFFEAAPPHASEVLETETYHVVDWLDSRAKGLLKAPHDQTSDVPRNSEDGMCAGAPIRQDDVAAVLLTPAGELRACLRLKELDLTDDEKESKKDKKQALERALAGATLVVDARLAGLRNGLLDPKAENLPRTVDDGKAWLLTTDNEPVVRFRLRVATTDTEQAPEDKRRWRERLRFATALSDEGEPGPCLIVEKWLHDAATEDDRSAGHPQLLDTHQRWAERRAHELAERLGLPSGHAKMLAIAARLHDEGKRARRWQRAFNAAGNGDYAKTLGPVNTKLLDGYRHEFGTLPVAEKDAEFLKLPGDLQELALHLIAAHHGFARPVIGTSGCEDAPPSAHEERARDVALRFARLQKQWGPWGLAWWEALLRSADQQASRDNDATDSTAVEEVV